MDNDAGLLGLWHPAGPAGTTVVLTDLGALDGLELEPGTMVALVGRGTSVRKAERIARSHGLVTMANVLTVPASSTPEHVLSMDGSLRWSGPDLLGWGPRLAALVAMVAGARDARMMRVLAPSVAVLATLPAALPLMEWLGHLGPVAAASRSVREDAVTATLRCGASPRGPEVIVQVGLDRGGNDRIQRAEHGVRVVAPTTAGTGIAVPTTRQGPKRSLTTEVLSGRNLATLIAQDPGRLETVGTAAVEAVCRWNRVSAHRVDDAITRALVVGVRTDAALVAVHDPLLGRWCDEVVDRLAASGPVVSVAVHGDLTAWNIVTEVAAPIGLVDWETAAIDGFPMTDLWYLLADLLVASGSTRRDAVLALWDGTAAISDPMADAPSILHEALDIDSALGAVLFDVTWISHAANEIRRGVPGEFVATVRALAQRVPID